MKLIIKITFVSLICSILVGCDDFTETDLPPTQLYSEYVFEDKATAMAAMADVFARMRDNAVLSGTTSGMSHQLGLYSDELDYFGNVAESTIFYQNALLPSTSSVGGWWNESYKQIYATNSIIEGVNASNTLISSDKDLLLGEAYFVRAFIHLNLTLLFGDIPYIVTTDYRSNSHVSRIPQSNVFDLIVADLEIAKQKLGAEYTENERIRPNKFAANALLARTYLFAGKWEEAIDQASIVINETSKYTPETDLGNVFLKNSTTTIWQFKPRVEGRNSDEGVTFIFTQTPPPGPVLSTSLISSFEPGDLRKENWTQAVTNGAATWFHANKYKKNINTGTSVEYSIILRLAEQYLIRAEARAQNGDLIGAKEDLNVIRIGAGLNETTANTQAQILQAILNEIRVEFFTEYGHRFFSLKRFNQLDSALSSKPGWNSTDRLLPVPEREIGLNPNLAPQNPGY
ncbi:RagB/SusD family nutrient uptake outer membrane protein [Flavobacterium plurextorum]|uniref:RagB/SusD family nutrient uptake outer membrane protein n=1 Tax=Flavobacterium plurextorum TaxID=1114867 RepID=UPI003757D8E3